MGNRYVVSDLHGQLDLYNKIKEYVNDDDIIYALGDFGDRGPEPWLTLKAALDDKQIVYLMGNHDLMLIKAIDEYMLYKNEDGFTETWRYHYYHNGDIALLDMNGGIETLAEWAEEPNRMDYYEKLLNAPLELRLAARNLRSFIYLTHAGRTPGEEKTFDVEDFVWDRKHFFNIWDNTKNHLSIGGHTPISVMIDYLSEDRYELKEGCLFYDNGAKINIDRGAHFTGETVLLNIDTLKGKVFKTKLTEKNEKRRMEMDTRI